MTSFANTGSAEKSGNALDPDTYYYNKLAPYLTGEYRGYWGKDHGKSRRCPMSKANWGEDSVWVGVYYSRFDPERAPFTYLNLWGNSTLTKKCNPFKTSVVRVPSNYLMMLDARRDQVFEPVEWIWDTDYDGD